MTNENRENAPVINHEDICNFVAERCGLDNNQIDIILEHGVEYINSQEPDENGQVGIDPDEQIAYIKRQPNVTLSEEQIEIVLDLEMEFLVEKGIADRVEVEE